MEFKMKKPCFGAKKQNFPSVPGYVGDAPVGECDDDLEGGGLDAGQGDVDVVLEREVGEVRAQHLREQLGDGRDHTPEDGVISYQSLVSLESLCES